MSSTDDDQLAEFKDWWQRNGKPLLTGGLLAAVAVGLSAYASHGVATAQAQSHVQMAALFAFGHGLALAALAPGTTRRLGTAALCLLLLGTLLFAGSLVGGASAWFSANADDQVGALGFQRLPDAEL